MDIRKSEEFKAQQKIIAENKLRQEISGVNIVKNMLRTEELRISLYDEAMIGNSTSAVLSLVFAGAFYVYSYTSSFRKYFPRAEKLFKKTSSARLLILLLSYRVGIFCDQIAHEMYEKKQEFKEYSSAYDYTESLKALKYDRLNHAERFRLITGIDIMKNSKDST